MGVLGDPLGAFGTLQVLSGTFRDLSGILEGPSGSFGFEGPSGSFEKTVRVGVQVATSFEF